MRLASLFSGGKDSAYATYLMEQQGHTVDLLVSIVPEEKNSWLFHTPNLHLLPLQAMAMEKKLLRMPSRGGEEGDLEALREVLSNIDVEGVVAGAIASDYQWDRINGVCEGMGLRVFSPLWRKDQSMLMRDLIEAGLEAMVVAVAAEGLGEGWLGRKLDLRALEELEVLSEEKGVNVSGEGGEYESMVLDSPLHSERLQVLESKKEWSRDGGRLTVKQAKLEAKGR